MSNINIPESLSKKVVQADFIKVVPLSEDIPKFLRNEVVQADIIEVVPQLPDESVDLMFLDPPFNLGKQYGPAVDDSLEDEVYHELLISWLDVCIPKIKPTGSIVVYHIPKWSYRIASYLESRELQFRGWVARKAAQRSYKKRMGLSAEHYSFVWFSRSNDYIFNQIKIPHKKCKTCNGFTTNWGGKEKFRNPLGKVAPDIWDDTLGPRGGTKIRKANELPLELVLRWVLTLTNPNGYVFDPFLGSGTTAAASIISNRHWGGVEIEVANIPIIRVKRRVAAGVKTLVSQRVNILDDAQLRVDVTTEMMRSWAKLDHDTPGNEIKKSGQQAVIRSLQQRK